MIRRVLANSQLLSAGLVGTTLQQRWVRHTKYWKGPRDQKAAGLKVTEKLSPIEKLKSRQKKKKKKRRKKMGETYKHSSTYQQWVRERSHAPRTTGTRKLYKEEIFVRCAKQARKAEDFTVIPYIAANLLGNRTIVKGSSYDYAFQRAIKREQAPKLFPLLSCHRTIFYYPHPDKVVTALAKQMGEQKGEEGTKRLREYVRIVNRQPYIQKTEEFYGLIFAALERNKEYKLMIDTYLTIMDYAQTRLPDDTVGSIMGANLLNFKEPYVQAHIMNTYLPLHGVCEPNANFVLMDALMGYARPAPNGTAEVGKKLHERLERCLENGKGTTVVKNSEMLKIVLGEYGKNAGCAGFFENLGEISKRNGFWDNAFYANLIPEKPKEEAKPKEGASGEKNEKGAEEKKAEVPKAGAGTK